MLENLPPDFVKQMKVVSRVLPFRSNNYIVDELIDWNNLPEDPIFQLTFPQPEMLSKDDFDLLYGLIKKKAPEEKLRATAYDIQMGMNPHPGGQKELNVPELDGKILDGMQHKYDETVLFFPAHGQTCHAFCTFCFRWPQFVKLEDLKFESKNVELLIQYIKKHPEVTDVLITGGDPLFMRTKMLKRYIEPLVKEKPANLTNIRIGTKALSFWPYRFVSDKDADDLLRLFEDVVKNGYHLSLMAHFSHPRELETPVVQKAIRRIIDTGAFVRCQSPVIRKINDNPFVWEKMWKLQVKLGAIPYYMFVARDTGPKDYFKLSLAKAYEIFTKAYKRSSGLCRTVRGPSMSATPGKILIDGIIEINDEQYFVLKFIQGRNPKWVNKIFFANFDEDASWLNELEPAFGEEDFFFSDYLYKNTRKKDILSRHIYAK